MDANPIKKPAAGSLDSQNKTVTGLPSQAQKIRTLSGDIAALQGLGVTIDSNSKNNIANKTDSGDTKDRVLRVSTEEKEITKENQYSDKSSSKSILNEPREIKADEPKREKPEPTLQNPFGEEEVKPKIVQEKKTSASPIHTYTSDVAEAIKKQGTSIANIAVAENERTNKRKSLGQTEPKKSHTLLMVIVGILLLSLGSGVMYYILITYRPTSLPESRPVQKDLIAAERTAVVPYLNTDRDTLVKSFLTIINASSTDSTVIKIDTVATSTLFLNLIQARVSDSLVRSFDPQFFFGAYSSAGENKPFIIFKSNSYPNSVAGMLTWEKTLIQDLQDIFLKPSDHLVAPFFTATVNGDSYTFKDGILENQDVRFISDKSGNILLMYSFINNTTLIIANSQSVFKEIINRLIQIQFVR